MASARSSGPSRWRRSRPETQADAASTQIRDARTPRQFWGRPRHQRRDPRGRFRQRASAGSGCDIFAAQTDDQSYCRRSAVVSEDCPGTPLHDPLRCSVGAMSRGPVQPESVLPAVKSGGPAQLDRDWTSSSLRRSCTRRSISSRIGRTSATDFPAGSSSCQSRYRFPG
jgi:hypothetical protein